MSECLTPVERKYLELLAGDSREAFADEVAKILRIHDAQSAALARVKKLAEGLDAEHGSRTYETSDAILKDIRELLR